MTTEILLVFAVLAVTIVLFVSEKLRIDVIALLIMVALPWLGLVEPLEALSGLSSNAVVSIIAVMILGHGVDRSGVMNRFIAPVLRAAGENERRLTGVLSGTVGLVSGFMQNIGAAALFLPGIMRISKKQRIPASRLLMPVGFAAILGGTLTMIASSPLIMLNDLLGQGGEEAFRLFSVTPIGIVLLASGIIYFLVFGKWVLPEQTGELEEGDTQEELIRVWGLLSSMYCVSVPAQSELNGKMLDEIAVWDDYNLHVIGKYITMVQATFRDIFNLGTDFPVDGSQFDVLLGDGETLDAGPIQIKAIHTPGHTPACLTYQIGDALFVGDAIFMPDFGTARCDFPGGSGETLYDSIQRLYALPDETRMFTCHDYMPGGRELRYESTIGEQKKSNVQLSEKTTKEAYVAFRTERDAGLSLPKLILPSLQVNIRAGRFPEPEENGTAYLKIPLNKF